MSAAVMCPNGHASVQGASSCTKMAPGCYALAANGAVCVNN
jgi:hypothetical protein